MADEIVQKLGFDASDTLTTLSNLEALFNRFNASLNSAATAIKSFNSASSSVTKPLDEAMQKTQSLTLSWQTMARVVQTQLIVRSLNGIRDALEESVGSAMRFSKQVGEIRAIDPTRNFQQIGDDIRRLSDAFNQPLAEVAEAQYQTISSQFTSATDQTNILTAANQLAKVTAQDLSSATLLLAGSLNAYGESSDMAGLRSAQFFKTVELGRVRLNELGTALGRVQSIGHESGVSLEELEASLVAITLGGVKANEASTQLRGVLTAFLKPTQDMQKALKELGVESGEAAIATWGLQGAVAQLWKLAGSASGMSKLFPNIRGDAGSADA